MDPYACLGGIIYVCMHAYLYIYSHGKYPNAGLGRMYVCVFVYIVY